MTQTQFDRYANTVFATVLGFMVGSALLLADANAWLAVAFASLWTAHVATGMQT